MATLRKQLTRKAAAAAAAVPRGGTPPPPTPPPDSSAAVAAAALVAELEASRARERKLSSEVVLMREASEQEARTSLAEMTAAEQCVTQMAEELVKARAALEATEGTGTATEAGGTLPMRGAADGGGGGGLAGAATEGLTALQVRV